MVNGSSIHRTSAVIIALALGSFRFLKFKGVYSGDRTTHFQLTLKSVFQANKYHIIES